ncbi:MAG: hypothetical protein ACTSR9_17475 [Candidatus Thorarchaeota archaeon]
MVHNRECLECGTIGEWNWAKEKERKLMPNGEWKKFKVPVKGEPFVKCPKCGHKFQPHSHTKFMQKKKEVQNNGN